MSHWKSVLFAVTWSLGIIYFSASLAFAIHPYLKTQQELVDNQKAIVNAINQQGESIKNLEQKLQEKKK